MTSWRSVDLRKQYRFGGERICSPSETLSRVTPLLADFGISRVADLTALDRIGIPVFAAIRPNSRGLSVSQGKGLDADSARVSAIMESLEHALAEGPECPIRIESYYRLARRCGVVDPWRLPFARHASFDSVHILPWARAENVVSGEPCWVPYELVHSNATIPAVPGTGVFVQSTNGLASGNVAAEAILHGLYELIERDALALCALQSSDQKALRRIRCDTIYDPINASLLKRFETAGIDVFLWDVTSNVGVPCFHCIIVDRDAHPRFRPLPAAFGSGCHLDSHFALSRALTEAAQSRLTFISGARDDISLEKCRMIQSEEAFEEHSRRRQEVGCVDFPRSLPHVSDTFEADIERVCELLTARGMDQILFVDLSIESLPFHVVRVIVPGLEGPTESALYTPGVRARASVQ